jgi:UDP-N-acetylglucosamine 2-epimerase (non-hydrolysing)
VIAVVFGTTGELIKLAPVLRSLRDRGSPPWTLCTGQQVEQIPRMLDDFGLSQPDVWLGRGFRGRDLERAAWIPPWLSTVATSFARERPGLRARLRAAPTDPLVLVHGDTFTTVIGALMGRSLRVPVAHLEAGLRSGNWRHPFPEELDRRVTSLIARIHLAPGPHAVANLRAMRVRGEVVDTGGNTIRDALDLVPPAAPKIELPAEPFGLVSLHRFELLGKPRLFKEILELLRESSRRRPLVFIDHPVTASAIESQHLGHLFGERFQRVPRQPYYDFISLLKASAFLVTDSGGSQEECSHLGHPCVVHRVATERPDGLDGPVVLSRMDLGVVARFLDDPLIYARAPVAPETRPTDTIIEHLERRGFVAPPFGVGNRPTASDVVSG